MVLPEGERGNARHWKTGTYRTALTSQVPIVLAYVDCERTVNGPCPVFQPTGDIEADLAVIERFCAPIKGRNATQFEVE